MQIIRLPVLEAKIGLKHSKIYQMISEGSFPAPIEIGPRARGWIELEVDDWIRARSRKRVAPPQADRAA